MTSVEVAASEIPDAARQRDGAEARELAVLLNAKTAGLSKRPPPTEPGCYWARHIATGSMEVVRVFDTRIAGLVLLGHRGSGPQPPLRGDEFDLWSERIPEPPLPGE